MCVSIDEFTVIYLPIIVKLQTNVSKDYGNVFKATRLACVQENIWSVAVWTSSFFSPQGSILVLDPQHPVVNCTLTVIYWANWTLSDLLHQCRCKAVGSWDYCSASDMFEATWLGAFIVLSVCFDLSVHPAVDMNVFWFMCLAVEAWGEFWLLYWF